MAATAASERVELLRFVNDAIYELAQLTGMTKQQAFVCECDDLSCTRRVFLTPAEYAARNGADAAKVSRFEVDFGPRPSATSHAAG